MINTTMSVYIFTVINLKQVSVNKEELKKSVKLDICILLVFVTNQPYHFFGV